MSDIFNSPNPIMFATDTEDMEDVEAGQKPPFRLRWSGAEVELRVGPDFEEPEQSIFTGIGYAALVFKRNAVDEVEAELLFESGRDKSYRLPDELLHFDLSFDQAPVASVLAVWTSEGTAPLVRLPFFMMFTRDPLPAAPDTHQSCH